MRLVTLCLLAQVICVSGSFAQGDTDFDRWKQQQRGEFQQFASARDREFAEYLRTHWQEFEAHKALVRDDTPKPKEQPRVPGLGAPVPKSNPVSPQPEPHKPQSGPQSKPVSPQKSPVPLPDPVQTEPELNQLLSVDFYGNALQFPRPQNLHSIQLAELAPAQFAETWLALAGTDFQALLKALQAKQSELQLPDWALLQLVRKVIKAEIQHSATATAYSWYLLNQLGFDVRLGYSKTDMALLMPADVPVYGRPFFTIHGERYYRVDGGPANSLRIHTAGFPSGNGQLRLGFDKLMHTPGEKKSRQLRFIDGGRIANTSISYDPHWVAFLQDHPAIDLEHYFRALVFGTTAKSLDDFWRSRIQQDTPELAVNRLLQFVQNGFKYQTDDEQFGRERYLLPSESFHYAAIDCEDRSFLLAWLIKDLLNLPVVGLHYPGHVALAVALPGEPEEGAAVVEHGGKIYTVADPTYIGAKIGQVMPKFQGVKPELLAAQ
ncbi:hypothetical protein [Microbulbifer aggregans]|uniref:hypothetical protein n=1 Tax=Microbulbifer aggregans TaxID=1769779 RepID=UPI001CFD0455|nr:hypothetical protein [Microbulbifer aggregans]